MLVQETRGEELRERLGSLVQRRECLRGQKPKGARDPDPD
jgi:hypothetical protein